MRTTIQVWRFRVGGQGAVVHEKDIRRRVYLGWATAPRSLGCATDRVIRWRYYYIRIGRDRYEVRLCPGRGDVMQLTLAAHGPRL